MQQYGVKTIVPYFLPVSCDLDKTVTGDMQKTSWRGLELRADRRSGKRSVLRGRERVSVLFVVRLVAIRYRISAHYFVQHFYFP